jgi:hypothetical protein
MPACLLEHPRSFGGPGSMLDLACLIVFTFSATCYYRLHGDDENQDYYLICGILASVGVGMSAGLSLEDSLVGILPWGIMLSLFVSSFRHTDQLSAQHSW